MASSNGQDNSSAALAAFRKSPAAEFAGLAEEHMKHDLQQSDRDTLNSAAKTLTSHATIGTFIGLGLGLALAWRVRRGRLAAFKAFKAHERPTMVQFADGRTEPIPDVTPLLKPTPLGDIFAILFFSAGGVFIGGETGLLTGSWHASSKISSDPESRQRIESAFRRFRSDVLKQEVRELEREDGNTIRKGKDILGI